MRTKSKLRAGADVKVTITHASKFATVVLAAATLLVACSNVGNPSNMASSNDDIYGKIRVPLGCREDYERNSGGNHVYCRAGELYFGFTPHDRWAPPSPAYQRVNANADYFGGSENRRFLVAGDNWSVNQIYNGRYAKRLVEATCATAYFYGDERR